VPPGPTPEFVLARPRTAPLDPPPAYSRLCEEAPISRVTIGDGRRGAWLVTRWEDARAVLGHPAFSSDPSQPLSGGGPDAPNPWGRDRREVPGLAVDLPPVRRRIRGRHRAL
jgi:cytochrome P450